VSTTSGGIVSCLFLSTLLMILFRRRYPRWWFDFALELTRFGARVCAYFVLLTDEYPSTVEEQEVHLEIDYPDVERDLNRWLPLVKWLLALPHILVLFFLSVAAFFAVLISWFAIVFTGRSCSLVGIRGGCSTLSSGSAAGGCGSRHTRSFWSLTGTRPSHCADVAARTPCIRPVHHSTVTLASGPASRARRARQRRRRRLRGRPRWGLLRWGSGRWGWSDGGR